jgi:hypothetical protein
MTFKLPRLPINWREQPQLFERYWDSVLSGLEKTVIRTDANDTDITSLQATIAVLTASQPASKFFSSPSGAAGPPLFRSIVSTDVPTLNQNTTGNAGTATKLQTARTISGVAFDGSANITVPSVIQSSGQQTISVTTTLGATHKGANLVLDTAGITLTFPSSGFLNGEGVAISNVSGGNITLSFPGGSDTGTTLPANGSLFLFCTGSGFWRQYCYSTSRL